MDEGFPQPSKPKPEKKEDHHLMSRFFYNQFLRRKFLAPKERGKIGNFVRNIRFYPGIKENGGKLKYLLYLAEETFGDLFKRKEKEFKSLLADLETRTFANDEEMLTAVVDAIYEFVIDENNKFTREELEKNYKMERADKIPLNEIFDCNKDKKNPSLLRVHLMGTSKFTAEQIHDGCKALADKLQNDSELKNVQTISLTSYIIRDHPKLVEKLGFTVLEENEEDKKVKQRRAEMPREKFIEKYSNENNFKKAQ